MFGNEPEKHALEVTLTLTSGERLRGAILLSRMMKLFEVLNKPETFLEFRGLDGRIRVVAKGAIEQAATMELPKADQLKRGSTGAFDPHQLLGVDAGAGPQDIRAAYVAKARLYHPDQFANHPLPPEVSEYLQAMFVHVQSAYELLSPRGGNKEREPAEAEA